MHAVDHIEDRTVYTMGQTDLLIGLTSGTAWRWIDGYERGGVTYEPLIRPATTGDDLVTWGEFVETRLLSEFRSSGVSLQQMRRVIERLRDRFGVQYPLACRRPYLSLDGNRVVEEVQREADLDDELRLVLLEVATDQYKLSLGAQRFTDSVREWLEDDLAVAVRASTDQRFWAIVLDPRSGFGEPTIGGLRTEALAELVIAGDAPDGVAEIFDVPVGDVHTAVEYERSRPRSAVAV